MTNHGYIKIPLGKLVRFKQGGILIPGTEKAQFQLEEDINIIMGSSFSSVTESNSSAFLSLLSKEVGERISKKFGAFTGGQWKQFGFQTWTSTAPMSTSVTIVCSMEFDAYKEVVLPLMALAKLCLPTDIGSGELFGPGPSLTTSLQKDGIDEIIKDEENKIITAGRQLHCYIGSYRLKNILIKGAQPTFSRQIDNNGYPISGRIQLDIQTVYSATTNMVDDMIKKV